MRASLKEVGGPDVERQKVSEGGAAVEKALSSGWDTHNR